MPLPVVPASGISSAGREIVGAEFRVADDTTATEAAFGVFHSPKGDLKLAVFNSPTPQIAMDRVVAFQNLPGAVAKRSGPLVAVVVSPPDPDEAERLLAQVQYRADITQQEHIPTRRDNIGNLVVNAFILAGILLVFCVAGGLGVGGLKVFRRRGKNGRDGRWVEIGWREGEESVRQIWRENGRLIVTLA